MLYPNYRFQPADHVFGSVDDYPENRCYCAQGGCPKRGVFNVSKCQFGMTLQIFKEKALKISRSIIVFLKTHINDAKVGSVFPNLVYAANNEKSKYSRLAWCYGDLSIGYVLYQAGEIFMDEELSTLAIDIIFQTTKRKSHEDTYVNDAGICHGSAGIAHIYNKIWLNTNNHLFKDACDFWIKKTIDYAKYDNECAGFKSFEPLSEVQYKNNYSLLEGISGIGLVLLSYITGKFDWDYCLMLN